MSFHDFSHPFTVKNGDRRQVVKAFCTFFTNSLSTGDDSTTGFGTRTLQIWSWNETNQHTGLVYDFHLKWDIVEDDPNLFVNDWVKPLLRFDNFNLTTTTKFDSD